MLARLWWLSELQFSIILSNFEILGGLDPRKINMGFEAGEQAAGGIWRGEERDKEATCDIVRPMIWAVNPKLCSASASIQALPTICQRPEPNLEANMRLGPSSSFHQM